MSELWKNLPAAQRALSHRPLFTVRLTVPPALEAGDTRFGSRRVATVESGYFEGASKELSGRVHGGGCDWICQPADGSVRLDARIVLESHGGDRILMSYYGIRHGHSHVLNRLASSEPVDPADYYFRIVPLFETSSRKFDWLNRIVAIGVGQRVPDGVLYSVFEIL